MSEQVLWYGRMKAALEAAEEAGFEVSDVYSDKIYLSRGGVRRPEFPFTTAGEIHCYINGFADGKRGAA